MVGVTAVLQVPPVSFAREPSLKHRGGRRVSERDVLRGGLVAHPALAEAVERGLAIGIGMAEVVAADHVIRVRLGHRGCGPVPAQRTAADRSAVRVRKPLEVAQLTFRGDREP